MTRIFLDVHALQTVPPQQPQPRRHRRTEDGRVRGVPRALVSSQAWKRATRTYFADEHLLEPSELGVPTKNVVEVLAERIAARDESLRGERALVLADETVKATGLKTEVSKRKADAAKETGETPAPEAKYLVFLSARQLEGLARLAVDGAADITAFLKQKANRDKAREIADSRHSVDVALFGRMVADADAGDFNVDAASGLHHGRPSGAACAMWKPPAWTWTAVADAGCQCPCGGSGRWRGTCLRNAVTCAGRACGWGHCADQTGCAIT